MSFSAPKATLLLAGALVLAALVAGPASADLPRTYQVQRVDGPLATAGAGFGGGLAAVGDLNGDSEDDFALGQGAGSPGGAGQVFVFSGDTGQLLDTIVAPDPGGAGSNSLFGVPFVDKMPDIGSCAGRTTGQLCTNPIGAKDGVPELLIGARGIDVGGFNDIGRAYVYDGATRALMKRIDMPAGDRTATAISSGGTWYGRVVFSPTGLPPCAGNQGVGTCPTLPLGERSGDLDGGGAPDVVVGASRYTESPATAAPGSHCAAAQPNATCVGAGRAYVYRGEDIAGSDPSVVLETALRVIRNPAAQADDPTVFDVTARRELFANAMAPVGDVGACTTAMIAAGEKCPFSGVSTTLDGRPEYVVSGFRIDLPANNPDPSLTDAGVNYLIDGATGAVLYTYAHPEPQQGAIMGSGISGLPVGDLGDTGRPDVFLPAVTQSNLFKADGRGYVMTGALAAFTSTINFARLNDPTPAVAGNFSAGYAAVGNVVAQTGKFRNELLVGAGHLGEPGNAELVNDIHFFDPLKEEAIQSITDPDAEPGSRFGADVVALGDLNDDGFLDFGASAPGYDGAVGAGQGRVYLFRSDNSPAPPGPPTTPPTTPRPGTTTAVTRSGRALELAASRESVRRRQRVTLRGVLESFTDASCAARQAVELQRRRPGSARYRTFARATSDGDGDFSRGIRPTRTYFYRALARETSRCAGVASAREKVTVKRRRR